MADNPIPFLRAVLASLALALAVQPASAADGPVPTTVAGREAELDELFAALQQEDADWMPIESRIEKIWSTSGSDSMDLLLERGRSAMEEGDFPKAVEHLSALIDHAPDFAEAWNLRATTYFLMGEYGLSIGDVQQALAYNPRHFGALSGLGIMLEELGDNENALRALQASQALNPHHADINDAILRLEKATGGSAL